jgi:hypothetical protein
MKCKGVVIMYTPIQQHGLGEIVANKKLVIHGPKNCYEIVWMAEKDLLKGILSLFFWVSSFRFTT